MPALAVLTMMDGSGLRLEQSQRRVECEEMNEGLKASIVNGKYRGLPTTRHRTKTERKVTSIHPLNFLL